jgi:hypothetical protein
MIRRGGEDDKASADMMVSAKVRLSIRIGHSVLSKIGIESEEALS